MNECIVVFLDFDGVLNGNDELIRKQRARIKNINSEKEVDLILETEENLDQFWASEMVMANIQNFMDSLQGRDIRIVLSTSWKRMKTLEAWNEQFRKIKGWTWEIIGRTPNITEQIVMETVNGYQRTTPRGLEIKTWLSENNWQGRYLILDDDDDMLPEQKDSFIQTNSDLGFTIENKKNVISFLEGK